jgi:hypothetical protein
MSAATAWRAWGCIPDEGEKWRSQASLPCMQQTLVATITLALSLVGCNCYTVSELASIHVRVTTGLAPRRCVEDGMVGACMRRNFTQRQALSMRNPAHSMENSRQHKRGVQHACRGGQVTRVSAIHVAVVGGRARCQRAHTAERLVRVRGAHRSRPPSSPETCLLFFLCSSATPTIHKPPQQRSPTPKPRVLGETSAAAIESPCGVLTVYISCTEAALARVRLPTPGKEGGVATTHAA